MTTTVIPYIGLTRQYQNLKEELIEASDMVLSSGQVLDGQYVEQFECQIARRCERSYAIAVGSCTTALLFAQLAQNIIHSKVLIPTQSFIATLNSVVMANNTPVFCDVDESAMLDIEQTDFALDGAGIGAIMYVNLFGNILDYDKLQLITGFFNPASNIILIEDAAQSFGATYKGKPSGSLGDISVLSFDPTKNLPNYGSGGMILTDDLNIATTCLDLRDNGKIGFHMYAGTNSKMSEVDCAHMLIKLKYFDAWQKRRQEIANFYTEHLISYVDPILPTDDVTSAWSKYAIRVDDRNSLQNYLSAQGIATKIHYPTPLHEHDIGMDYAGMNHYINAVAHSKETLSLPLYPELTDEEIETIATAVVEHYTGQMF